jgi:hypothetical protein
MSGHGFHVHGPHDQMHEHTRRAQATTALQVPIALAALHI